jgi:hypothetical protein
MQYRSFFPSHTIEKKQNLVYWRCYHVTHFKDIDIQFDRWWLCADCSWFSSFEQRNLTVSLPDFIQSLSTEPNTDR